MGFADASLGTQRRTCICDVLTYIQSVISLAAPSGTGSSQIEIEVRTSAITSPGVLGVATPFYPPNQIGSTTPGIFGGSVFDHITTGIDPEANQFDGTITINFQNISSITPTCSSKTACQFDLYSIILHEFTHTLGFASYITDDVFGNPKSYASPVNQFTRFDNIFLYYGDLAGSKVKLLNGTNPSSPVLNAGTKVNDNKIWLYNTVAKTNQPISSAAALSHFDDYYNLGRTHDAPGFTPDYVMAAALSFFQVKREYTMQEIRMLQALGYQIKSTYYNYSIIGNSPPYLKLGAGEGMIGGASVGTTNYADALAGLPAATKLSSITSCQTKTITLGATAGLYDPDGDPIRIYPNSLTNLRGCGSGGNNHNQLSVTSSATGDVITFTPRNNFIGLVQFGFHTWDGKEKGAFVVYSFYVTRDNNCFNNGSELVINGGFEEGVEVTLTTNTAIQNNILYNSRYLGGSYYSANDVLWEKHFADGAYLNYSSTDVIIKDSYQPCAFGEISLSLLAGGRPAPISGSRYLGMVTGEETYIQLSENIVPCVQYVIDFDYAVLSSNSATINFPVGFSAQFGAGVIGQTILSLPGVAAGSWGHYTGTISMGGGWPLCNLLNINQGMQGSNYYVFIDNMSLKKAATGACACNTPLPATISANYYANASLNMAQTSTISGNVTFDNCDILMGKDARIDIPAGATLTITSTNATQFSHLHACGDMWDGIHIQPGGKLMINNSSLVEDAKTAVVAHDGTSDYNISGAIFNKNYYAMQHLPTAVTSVATRSVVNSLFTCRVFGANPNILTYIQSAAASTPALLTALPKAVLVAPYAGTNAFTGIDADNITGSLNIGNRTLPINIFDNLYYGVQGRTSNVYVRHNTFQNMVAVPPVCITTATMPPMTLCISSYPNGAAVFANTSAGTNALTIQVGGSLSNERNTFTNCYEAIHTAEYANVTVRNNQISNNAATPGNYGVYVLNSISNNIHIANNSINNCSAGIYNLRQGVNASGAININGNAISASGGAIVSSGIRLQDLTAAQQSKNIFVNVNNISGVETGISLDNVKASAQVSGNTITLNSLNAAGAARRGILLTNAGAGPGGNYNDVSSNTINGGITAPTLATTGIKGIYAYLSPNTNVTCNTVNNVGQSLVFEGTCSPSTVNNNAMNTAWDGIVLTNSGIIGAQGSTAAASDNLWAGAGTTAANFVNSQALANNSNGASSPFYVRSSSPDYNPLSTKNKLSTGSSIPFYNTASPSAGCGGGIGGIITGGGSGGGGEARIAETTSGTATSAILPDQQISSSATQYPVYTSQSRVFDQQAAYEYLQNNPSLIKGKYKKLYDSLSSTAIGACQKFNKAIQQNDTVLARSINNSFTAATLIEQNHQTINKYLLDGLTNGKYALALKEKNMVQAIASQCPLTGGRAVFQARILYNILIGRDTIFMDNCEATFANVQLKEDNRNYNAGFTAEASAVKLYPNPSGGNFILQYHIAGNANAVFELYDITGKKVDAVRLNSTITVAEIKENALENGTYFYRVLVSGRVIKSDKLIIIK